MEDLDHAKAAPDPEGMRKPFMIWSVVMALGSGALVGLSLALIGGGGSILATPLLLYVVGVSPPHVAIGTSALAVSANAYANLIGHARCGNVRWPWAIVFASVGTIGALAGSTIGKLVDGQRLLFLFGVVMVVVGVMMLRRCKAAAGAERTRDARACVYTVVEAFAVGIAAGFFGIGGGFLIVPGLILATGMPMINAVASSLLAVGSFGLATTVNYTLSGLVDWPVAAECIAGGVMGGLVGRPLANRLALAKGTLRLVFAAVMFVVAAYVLYRSGQRLVARIKSIKVTQKTTPWWCKCWPSARKAEHFRRLATLPTFQRTLRLGLRRRWRPRWRSASECAVLGSKGGDFVVECSERRGRLSELTANQDGPPLVPIVGSSAFSANRTSRPK
jgi:uncharacterized membrane protein YfcA